MIEVGRAVVCPSGKRGTVVSLKAEVLYLDGDSVLIDPELLVPSDPSLEECRELVDRHAEKEKQG